MENSRKNKMNSSYWLLALFLILIIQSVYQNYRDVRPVPYSEIEKSLEEGKIKQVVISDKTVTAELKTPENGKKAIVANRVETDLAERLSKFKVPYTRIIESTFLKDILSWILPTLFFFGIWFFVFRKFAEKQMGSGGFLNIGKTKAKVFVETNTGVNFTDVAGVDDAKQELRELVDFLKNTDEYGRLGAKIPKGVLLVGPPGTGKTLLAKAVAGEAKVPFFSISGSEFIEMFVGVGAARVRDLFEQARKQSPAIIFVDELDALGKARSVAGPMGGHDEREQTLNQLLVEMDGFDTTQGLIILAATNRPEILDPALLRAGRFDRQVLVDRPDKIGRIQILNVHIKKVHIADDIDLEKVAALTTGFSGADLANLVNEAALAATRRKASKVELEDFTYAIERIVAGLEKKNRVLNEKEKTIVAYHEMGHALVAKAIDGSDPVHKISIIPRGIGALGYTLQRPTEDRFIMEKEELEAKICVLLGGRAAELLKFTKLTTGASDDIQKATDIAREMITKYGMAEELGFVAYEKQRHTFLNDFTNQPGQNLSEATLSKIDDLTKKLIDECFSRATSILKKNFNILEESSKELLKKETLDEEDLVKLTKNMIRVE